MDMAQRPAGEEMTLSRPGFPPRCRAGFYTCRSSAAMESRPTGYSIAPCPSRHLCGDLNRRAAPHVRGRPAPGQSGAVSLTGRLLAVNRRAAPNMEYTHSLR